MTKQVSTHQYKISHLEWMANPCRFSGSPAGGMQCFQVLPTPSCACAPIPKQSRWSSHRALTALHKQTSFSQAGCGSGQPGLLVGSPAHSRGLEVDEHCGPFQPRPFYDSMVHPKASVTSPPAVLTSGLSSPAGALTSEDRSSSTSGRAFLSDPVTNTWCSSSAAHLGREEGDELTVSSRGHRVGRRDPSCCP